MADNLMEQKNMPRIALDAMGGDFGARVNVKGAVLAARKLGIETLLVGDEKEISALLRRLGAQNLREISVVHASESIAMDEHAAVSVRRKRDASINVAFDLLKKNEADAVVSAGNSGAVMAAALLKMNRLAGIERPAIAIAAPTVTGQCVALDMGANVECKPSHLAQFAIMGEVYARAVLGKERPAVGLLSNGTEESKGNELTRAAHEIIKKMDLHYKGYIEGRDIFRGEIDVVVCDGFVGNVVLKSIEGIFEIAVALFKKEFGRQWHTRLGLALFYTLFYRKMQILRRKFDYAEYGAAPLLGVNGVVLVCHGRSSVRAIKNALLTARGAVESEFLNKLSNELCRQAAHGENL